MSAYEIFRSLIRGLQPDGIPYAQIEDGMAFVIRAQGADWGRIKSALAEKFTAARRTARGKTGLHLVMGAGAPVDDLMACDKSFREAKRVVAMAKCSDNPAFPCFWEDMGVYRILEPIHDTQDSRDFIAEHLGALMSQENGAGDLLLQTLFCVIRNNWRLKPVASAMSLHYNTVKYRYRRIGEMLGVDLESQGTRLNLALAMELHALGKANGENGH